MNLKNSSLIKYFVEFVCFEFVGGGAKVVLL